MGYNAKIIKMIKDDINKCASFNSEKGSETYYKELAAKYSELNSSFPNNLETMGKIKAINSEWDYRKK